jgi:YD repeat-containing protein
MPGWLDGWRAGQRARKGTAAYVEALMREPDAADVSWLAEHATLGDTDRATWELRYVRRALGLLIAQRDALDDRTASAVAHQLSAAMAADRNVAASMVKLVDRQFNERLAGYREMMLLRGSAEQLSERLGRAMLLLSGGVRMGSVELRGANEIASRLLIDVSAALGRSFGVATLPESVPPSAVQN